MDSLSDLYDTFGGPAAVGRAIGVTTEHAGVMRRRGSVPIEHWPALLERARAEGIEGLDHEALTNIHIFEKRLRQERASRSNTDTPTPTDLREAV